MTSRATQYLPSLTGFRAVAAWMVFAHHYNPLPDNLFISGIVQEGYIGVSLFFVLSGFLIAFRYNTPHFNFWDYMRRRIARIYPLYFLMTTLTFLVAGEWGWTYLANITFTKGFIDDLKFTGISQGWSLSVEETFYLLAPFIFKAVRKSKFAWCIPAVLVLISWNDFVLMYTFLGRSFDFFAGIALAAIFKGERRNGQAFTWVGVAGILLCLFLLSIFRNGHEYGFQSVPGLLIHHLLVPVVVVVTLYGLLTESTWLRRFLASRSMQLLGRSSYAFYLVHLGVIAAWLSEYISSNVIILFVLLNSVAIALYYTVERPLRQYFLPKTSQISA